jgi:hypothetical protein
MLDATFDLTQMALIPLNSEPHVESPLRIPVLTCLHYNSMAITPCVYSHAGLSSPESGLVRPGSILSSSILESSYMGSSTYLVYGGGASTDMSNPTTKPAGAKKLEKVTLQYIASSGQGLLAPFGA